MRGHIRPYKPGVWHLVVDLPRGPDGKRRQKWVTVHGTRAEAEKALARLVAEVSEPGYAEPSYAPLADWLRYWLETKRAKVRPRTWESYRAEVENHLIPLLGTVALDRLLPLHVEEMLRSLLQEPRRGHRTGTLSATSVRYALAVLRMALEDAVRLGVLRENPAKRVRPPKAPRKKPAVLAPDEAARLLREASGSRYYAAIVLALLAGLREGEILGLRWQDVDWKAPAVLIRQVVFVTQDGLRIGPPKTEESEASVRISPGVVSVLRQHRARQAEERLKAGQAWQDHGLVFPARDGRPMHPSTLYHAFKRIAARAGLKELRFHDLRHGQATLLLARGVDLKVVSERLRHADVATTGNVYAHVLPDVQAEAASALDDLLPSQPRV